MQYFESLENRQLMSSTHQSELSALFNPALAAIEAQLHPATKNVSGTTSAIKSSDASTTTTLNLVGDFTGSVKVSFFGFSKKYGFSMHVDKQSSDSVTGSVTIAGHTFKGTLPVKFDGNSFSISLHDKHASGSLKGTVSEDGNELTASAKGSALSKIGSAKIKATRDA